MKPRELCYAEQMNIPQASGKLYINSGRPDGHSLSGFDLILW